MLRVSDLIGDENAYRVQCAHIHLSPCTTGNRETGQGHLRGSLAGQKANSFKATAPGHGVAARMAGPILRRTLRVPVGREGRGQDLRLPAAGHR